MVKKYKKTVKRVFFKDKRGRFSKLDKRKKLIKYIVYSDKSIKKQSPIIGSKIKKVKTSRQAVIDIIKKSITGRKLPYKKYDRIIKFEKSDNIDYHIYLSKLKFNQIVSKLAVKGIVLATIRILLPDYIGQKEVQITGINYPYFGEYSRRKGKRYTPKDIVARFIHQLLAESGFTPYIKGLSDGSIQKITNRVGKKRHSKKQIIEIGLRTVNKKSRRKYTTIDKFGHINKY